MESGSGPGCTITVFGYGRLLAASIDHNATTCASTALDSEDNTVDSVDKLTML